MDYQASTSGCKVAIRGIFQKGVLLIALGLLLPIYVSAQATNPLSGDITVSATVLLGYQAHPDTPPLSSGPVDTSNTADVAIFRGIAYPGSVVSLLKNGVVVTTQAAAKADGTFEIHLQNLVPGTYSFGIRAEDVNRLKSKLLLFSIYVSSSIITTVDGIFIPPTITSDYVEVKQGDDITFFGSGAPNADIHLSLNAGTDADTEVLKKAKVNASGTWMYRLNSGDFNLGDYNAKGRSIIEGGVSLYSDLLPFRIGDTTRMRAKASSLAGFRRRCDLNDDGRVNLLDFSIMAFWYKRLGFPPRVDLNTDGRINLTDLSILAYCWTG
jgi:hypothetical protein